MCVDVNHRESALAHDGDVLWVTQKGDVQDIAVSYRLLRDPLHVRHEQIRHLFATGSHCISSKVWSAVEARFAGRIENHADAVKTYARESALVNERSANAPSRSTDNDVAFSGHWDSSALCQVPVHKGTHGS